jgi:hypothetical protein
VLSRAGVPSQYVHSGGAQLIRGHIRQIASLGCRTVYGQVSLQIAHHALVRKQVRHLLVVALIAIELGQQEAQRISGPP